MLDTSGCLPWASRSLLQVTECCLPLYAASNPMLQAEFPWASPLLHRSFLEPRETGTSDHLMRRLQDVTLLLLLLAGQLNPYKPSEGRRFTSLALAAGVTGPLPPAWSTGFNGAGRALNGITVCLWDSPCCHQSLLT